MNLNLLDLEYYSVTSFGEGLGGSFVPLKLLVGAALVVCYGLYQIVVSDRTRSFGVISSWIEAWRFSRSSSRVIEEVLKKARTGHQTLQIPTFLRWIVVSTDADVLKELRNANESLLSGQAAANERNAMDYVLGPSIHNNPYHMQIISKHLVSGLASLLPDIADEVDSCLNNHWIRSHEWTAVGDLNELVTNSVAMITNRVLVGLPLCRDKVFLDCVVDLTTRISRAGTLCSMSPKILRPLIATLLVRRSGVFKKYMAKLKPVFQYRRDMLALKEQAWAKKPNDAIQWLAEEAPEDESLDGLCLRLLYLNFSSIHTTSISLMHAIYDLGAYDLFQNPIRAEIQEALQDTSQWNSRALSSMKKLDSSLKESQRLHPVTTATMMRRAQKPIILSDGSHLEEGQWIVAPAYYINRLPQYHNNPNDFDAFRFSNSKDSDPAKSSRGMGYPGPGYLSFGMGKHACPGRFFAAAELQIILGHILLNYDFRCITGERPKDKFNSFVCFPDTSSQIEIKRRLKSASTGAIPQLYGSLTSGNPDTTQD